MFGNTSNDLLQKDIITTNHSKGDSARHGSDSVANQDLDSHSNVQAQMEQSMQRSVTLVFWYKPKCEPIRLHYPIPTFPLFQLSHFPTLTSDLGLSASSYVDVYVPHTGQWEQNLITTVRFVERDQRLLYRTRKSLLDGFSEDDCLGLAEELSMQPSVKQTHSSNPTTPGVDVPTPGSSGALKRPATDMLEPPPVSKFYIVDGSQNQQIEPTARTHTYSLSPPSGSPEEVVDGEGSAALVVDAPTAASTDPRPASPTHMYHAPSIYQTGPSVQLPFSLTTSQSPAGSIPYHPHPPLKRWPNDYTVFEIASGFRLMDELVSQTPMVVQRTAFERVFGCRYVKSTVCRHRGVWRKADAELRATFEEMGSDERAVWGEFVRRVEGRPPGKIGLSQGQVVMPVQDQDVGGHSAHPSPASGEPQQRRPVQEEEEEEADDVVLGSLGHPPSNIAMRQVNAVPMLKIQDRHINVYDPALGNDGLRT